ncbi:MAG: ATP-dependent Clp protease adapter ClpS [Neisseriaceae bacterium]|nr:ATP-dependent Clp protease adapter ClpS [Neisseriaceae bacterium]
MTKASTRYDVDLEVVENTQNMPPPRKFKVSLINDDYTPMDFVVDVLTEVFFLNQDQAEAVMWQVHEEGKAVCGLYPKDIALTKVTQVMALAQEHGHPLLCLAEEE